MNQETSFSHRRNSPQLRPLPSMRFFSRTLLLLVYLPIFNILFATLATYTGEHSLWTYIPQVSIRLWSVTALVLCLLFLLEPRFLPADGQLRSTLFVIKYVVLGVLCLFIIGIVSRQITADPFPVESRVPFGPIMIIVFEVLLIAAMRSTLKQQQINHSLELNYRGAQHQALRAQLNPHFLFNSLNLISSEIEHDPELAVDLLDKLAELLRAALAATERPSISLGQELELLQAYLDIQQARFGDRLRCVIDSNNVDMGIAVPPMLLQPLVENSIQHGISPLKSGGTVTVTLSLVTEKPQGEHLLLEVHDDGRGFDPDEAQYGHGLSLVQDTMQLLYGKGEDGMNTGFQLVSAPGNGTTVTLTLPRYSHHA